MHDEKDCRLKKGKANVNKDNTIRIVNNTEIKDIVAISKLAKNE